MSRITPQTRSFAELLIAFETRAHQLSERKIPGAYYVCQKLRPPLSTLMGAAGFEALLSRALTLGRVEDRWLRNVQVNADGSLGGWDEAGALADPKATAAGSVVLIANLLALLVAFIGNNLTLRLLRDVWPKLPPNDFDFGNGNKK